MSAVDVALSPVALSPRMEDESESHTPPSNSSNVPSLPPIVISTVASRFVASNLTSLDTEAARRERADSEKTTSGSIPGTPLTQVMTVFFVKLCRLYYLLFLK